MIGPYELNNIYKEDCLAALKKLPNESVDLVVTDPPYLMNYKTSHRKDQEHKFAKVIQNDNEENATFIAEVIVELERIMKPNTAIYMFCNSVKIDFFKQEIEKHFNLKNIIVWVKDNWTAGDLDAAFGRQYENIIMANKGRKPLNGKRITDVWDNKNIMGLKKVAGLKLVHQNQKPLELVKMMIRKHSDVGDIVIDPFMGSGTTGVAAKELNRKFIGFEIDDDYHAICMNRINGIEESGQTSIFTNFEELGGASC